MFNFIVAQSFLASSLCNLSCSYCVIAKSSVLEDIQAENLKIIPINNNIQTLTLWGGEPSLGFEEFINRWDEVEEAFPNLKEIKTSTNQVNPDLVLEFCAFISKVRPDIKIGIQLSDDSIFNYTNRGIYSEFLAECTKKIVENVPDNIEISFSWKPTVTKNNLPILEYELGSYVEHFSNIYKNLKLKDNVIFPPVLGLTLDVPGNYTVRDGLHFKNIVKQVTNYQDNILEVTTAYHGRLRRLLDFGINFAINHRTFICSAGDTSLEVDRSGEFHFCHESYFFRNSEYINEVVSMNTKEAEYIKKNTIFTFPVGNELNLYAYRAFQDFYNPKVSYCQFALHQLAKDGQVLGKYADLNMSQLLSLFLVTECYCPAQAYLGTGSWHIIPDSLMLIFGNGAFDEIVKGAIKLRRDFNV